ncbi:MAG: hypothetical protein OXF79_27720 [Chloroflexi bacterium]|nr:hypothetical protein [Chloroflexota bacterium]
MYKPLRLTTTVLSGGRIEIVDLDLPEGETVDVVVTPSVPTPRRSALDILAEAPGQCLFNTAEEVDAYIQAERESWER